MRTYPVQQLSQGMKKVDLGQSIAILANLGVIAGIIFLAMEFEQFQAGLVDRLPVPGYRAHMEREVVPRAED